MAAAHSLPAYAATVAPAQAEATSAHLPPAAAGAAALQNAVDHPATATHAPAGQPLSKGVKRTPGLGPVPDPSSDAPGGKRVCSRGSAGGACAAPHASKAGAVAVRKHKEVKLVVSKTRTVRTDVEHFRRLVHALTGSHASNSSYQNSSRSSSPHSKNRTGGSFNPVPDSSKADTRTSTPFEDPKATQCRPASAQAGPAPSAPSTSLPQASVPGPQLAVQASAPNAAAALGERAKLGEPPAGGAEVGSHGNSCRTSASGGAVLLGEDRQGSAPTAPPLTAEMRTGGPLDQKHSRATACRDTALPYAEKASHVTHLSPLQVSRAAPTGRGSTEGSHQPVTPLGLDLPLYTPSPSVLVSLDVLGGRAAEREAPGNGPSNAGGAEESWGNQPASPGSLVLWDLAMVLAAGAPLQVGAPPDSLLSDGPFSTATSLSATSAGSAGLVRFTRSNSS